MSLVWFLREMSLVWFLREMSLVWFLREMNESTETSNVTQCGSHGGKVLVRFGGSAKSLGCRLRYSPLSLTHRPFLSLCQLSKRLRGDKRNQCSSVRIICGNLGQVMRQVPLRYDSICPLAPIFSIAHSLRPF